jgi:hypothetical protein
MSNTYMYVSDMAFGEAQSLSSRTPADSQLGIVSLCKFSFPDVRRVGQHDD